MTPALIAFALLRFPPLSNADAWKHLPPLATPLPAWAVTLAGPLPRTTAAMLELDAVQRLRNPLGPVLAARLRLTAAVANGCDYARRYAEADLARHKATPVPADAAEAKLLAFARKLTREGHALTDAEVAEIASLFGDEKLVNAVHTVAQANFFQRIVLALGVSVEPGGPLPPLELRFDASAKVTPAARPTWEARPLPAATPPPDITGAEQLAQKKTAQHARPGRVALPPPDALTKAGMPPDRQARTKAIVWSHVSMGYAPVLTKAWFDCMGIFQQEAKLDAAFQNTVFWVITRANDCFY